MSSCNNLMPYSKPRGNLPQHFGAGYQDPRGFLGAYVPADQYVHGCYATGCSASSMPPAAACSNQAQAMGPCAAGFGLDSSQLFPTSLDACDGFDQVLVSAPMDFLYADNLMDDVTVLTTTRCQTRDLRGEPAISAVYSCDENGNMEPGIAGGFYMPTCSSPYQYYKAVRTYIV